MAVRTPYACSIGQNREVITAFRVGVRDKMCKSAAAARDFFEFFLGNACSIHIKNLVLYRFG
jgi:hypothetical protein